MARTLAAPALRRGRVARWLAATQRWFQRAALVSHEIQLHELIARIEMLGDLDADPSALPLLRARLAEVRAELAVLDLRA